MFITGLCFVLQKLFKVPSSYRFIIMHSVHWSCSQTKTPSREEGLVILERFLGCAHHYVIISFRWYCVIQGMHMHGAARIVVICIHIHDYSIVQALYARWQLFRREVLHCTKIIVTTGMATEQFSVRKLEISYQRTTVCLFYTEPGVLLNIHRI